MTKEYNMLPIVAWLINVTFTACCSSIRSHSDANEQSSDNANELLSLAQSP